MSKDFVQLSKFLSYVLRLPGRHLELVRQDGWEYVRRLRSTGVVLIAARTAEQELLLIEQYRVPVTGRVVEFPAGLAGDDPGHEDEALRTAARRELLEETGYEAQRLHRIGTFTTSAGLTDERVTLFLADQCTRRQAGGGVGREDIQVHRVPLGKVDDWLQDKMQQGCQVDARVYTGLYWLRAVDSA